MTSIDFEVNARLGFRERCVTLTLNKICNITSRLIDGMCEDLSLAVYKYLQAVGQEITLNEGKLVIDHEDMAKVEMTSQESDQISLYGNT